MKICLMSAAMKEEWGTDTKKTLLAKVTGRAPIPLALPTLASLTPPDNEIEIIDERIQEIDFDRDFDLVGITALTCVVPRAYEIADEFRKRGVPVVLGGVHPTVRPEEAINHADSVVIGEADETWPILLDDFKKGKMREFYLPPKPSDLSKSRIPRWDLLKVKQYNQFLIQTAKGCPNSCEFCCTPTLTGKNYRHKPIDHIIAEIKNLQKIDKRKPIFFCDDNLLSKPSYAAELFKSLEPLKITWWCQASADRLNDDYILNLMRKAGCMMILIGLESVSQETLNKFNKGTPNKAEEFKETIGKVHDHGLMAFGSFIFGAETDSATIFEETSDFIEDTNMVFFMLSILTPLPGTVLWDKLEKKGIKMDKRWQKFDGNTLVFNGDISNEELCGKINTIYDRLHTFDKFDGRIKNLLETDVYVDVNKKKFWPERIALSLLAFSFLLTPRKFAFFLKNLWHPKLPHYGLPIMCTLVHDDRDSLKSGYYNR